MYATMLGCGEAFDDRYGNTSAVIWGPDVPTILLDCGYQVPERLWSATELPEIDAVCISHTHADHLFGIVPLLARFWEMGRTTPIRIIGPAGISSAISELLELGYPGLRAKFEFELAIEDVAESEVLNIGKARVKTARSVHSLPNFAFRVESPEGLSVAYSGDGALSEATRDLFRGADLLLHECFSSLQVTPMHTHLGPLVDYLQHDGRDVGRIGLVHVSRQYRAELVVRVAQLAKDDPRWFIAAPGQDIPVVTRDSSSKAA